MVRCKNNSHYAMLWGLALETQKSAESSNIGFGTRHIFSSSAQVLKLWSCKNSLSGKPNVPFLCPL